MVIINAKLFWLTYCAKPVLNDLDLNSVRRLLLSFGEMRLNVNVTSAYTVHLQRNKDQGLG